MYAMLTTRRATCLTPTFCRSAVYSWHRHSSSSKRDSQEGTGTSSTGHKSITENSTSVKTEVSLLLAKTNEVDTVTTAPSSSSQKPPLPGLLSSTGVAHKTPSSPKTNAVPLPTHGRKSTSLKPLREIVPDPEERAYHADVVHGRASLKPYRHEAPYRVPVAVIHFRSHWPRLLDLFTHFVEHAAASLGIPIGGVARLPTVRSLWTVPRGPFVHKKAQENFERLVHKRAIRAFDADPEVVDRWIMYLERHALAGVGMRVVRWHRVPVGIGRTQFEQIANRSSLGKVPVRDQVRQLGQQIIIEETKAATAVHPEDGKVIKTN